jgi:hypothetical protein
MKSLFYMPAVTNMVVVVVQNFEVICDKFNITGISLWKLCSEMDHHVIINN